MESCEHETWLVEVRGPVALTTCEACGVMRFTDSDALLAGLKAL